MTLASAEADVVARTREAAGTMIGAWYKLRENRANGRAVKGDGTNAVSAVDSMSPIDMVGIDAGRIGDRRASGAIVERFAEEVWTVVRSQDLTASQAADVCRLTWMRFADQVDALPYDMLESWLVKTAERESRRAIRLLAVVDADGGAHSNGCAH
jgi:hypothetical protein